METDSDAVLIRRLCAASSTPQVRNTLNILGDFVAGEWYDSSKHGTDLVTLAKELLQMEASAATTQTEVVELRQRLRLAEAQVLDLVADGNKSTRAIEDLESARSHNEALTTQLAANVEEAFTKHALSLRDENEGLRKDVASLQAQVTELVEQLAAVRRGAPSSATLPLPFLQQGQGQPGPTAAGAQAGGAGAGGQAGGTLRRVNAPGQE